MDNIPVHLRITGLTPSNEDVDSRRARHCQSRGSWGKLKDVDAILPSRRRSRRRSAAMGSRARARWRGAAGRAEARLGFLYEERRLKSVFVPGWPRFQNGA